MLPEELTICMAGLRGSEALPGSNAPNIRPDSRRIPRKQTPSARTRHKPMEVVIRQNRFTISVCDMGDIIDHTGPMPRGILTVTSRADTGGT